MENIWEKMKMKGGRILLAGNRGATSTCAELEDARRGASIYDSTF